MIGKTRLGAAAEVEETYDPEVGRAQGVLRRPLHAGKLRHSRRAPSADVAFWIAHYWSVSWDLRGLPAHIAQTLPHPNVHVVFENGTSAVSGVHTRKFSRVLEGQSSVFGIKFRPGGFRPFLESPVSRLRDRLVPARNFFGSGIDALEEILLSSRPEDDKVHAADAFFRARVPEPDRTIELAAELVARILQEPDIKTVDHLAAQSGIHKRSLERIFNEYVGVSPKWVIRRHRLHEAVERIHAGGRPDWAQLALDLGYFDQAHLINDFRTIVGYSPARYRKQVSPESRDR